MKKHIKCKAGCGCGNGYFNNFQEAKAKHDGDMWAYEMPHDYNPVEIDDATGKETSLDKNTGKPLKENTMKKSELKSLIKMIVTESHDLYLGEESTHEVKAGDRVRLINKGGYNNYQGTVTKIQMHGKSGPWADIKWDMPHHPCTTPMETKHLEVVVTEGQHPLPQDTHATDLNELTENNLQEKKTTMKKSELTQEGFIQDKLNNLFKINFRKLIKLLEKSGFSKDEYESGYFGLTYTKALDLTADDDGEGHVSVTFSSRVYDDITIQIYEEGFDEDEYYTVKGLSKKSDAEISDIVKKINSHVYRTDRPSPNSSAYKAYQQKRNDRRSLEENKHSNTMKKSELKSLLKVIIQEVVAAKQKRIDETKGLSGFKKSKDSTNHTENVASSKDLTGKGPVEKQEGKKLPVVKKPATPQKVGSIKEEILEMIREAISEADIEEIRVKGAVGSKFKVQDASSPTGYVVKGHKTIPDGTPTEAPKGPYVPKGIAGMGRPKKIVPVASAGGTDFDTATRGAIENILTAAPETTDDDIMKQLSSSASEEEVSLNLDPMFVKKTASELRKELSADTSAQPEDAPESDLAAMASSEEKRKAAQRAAWIKKLQAKRPIK